VATTGDDSAKVLNCPAKGANDGLPGRRRTDHGNDDNEAKGEGQQGQRNDSRPSGDEHAEDTHREYRSGPRRSPTPRSGGRGGIFWAPERFTRRTEFTVLRLKRQGPDSEGPIRSQRVGLCFVCCPLQLFAAATESATESRYAASERLSWSSALLPAETAYPSFAFRPACFRSAKPGTMGVPKGVRQWIFTHAWLPGPRRAREPA